MDYSRICEMLEKRLVKWEKVIEPNEYTHREYVKLYARWTEVYERMIRLVEDGLVEPMWRAAAT